MAEQFEIAPLGESLIERQRQTRKRTQKRAERNAWKAGLANAGVNLINRSLQDKAQQFLQSEPAMAVKAKFRSASEQAERVLNMRQEAMQQGLSMPEYFMKTRYLPEVTAEFASQYGSQYRPESYASQLRDIAWDLSNKEAQEYEIALAKALEVPAWDQVEGNLDRIMMPPANAGEALIGKIRGIFGGKPPEQIQQEILERLDQEGTIKNDNLRQYFDKVLVNHGLDEAVARVRALDASGFDENSKITQQVSISTAGGRIALNTIQLVEDGKGNTTASVVDTKVHEMPETKEERVTVLRDIMNDVDIEAVARETFTNEAYAVFTEMLGERQIDAANARKVVSTADGGYVAPNWEIMGQVYSQLAQNPANLRNDRHADRMANVMGLLASHLSNAFAASEGDPEEFMKELMKLAEFSNTLSGFLLPPSSIEFGQ